MFAMTGGGVTGGAAVDGGVLGAVGELPAQAEQRIATPRNQAARCTAEQYTPVPDRTVSFRPCRFSS